MEPARKISAPAVYFFSHINNKQIDCESALEADFCLTREFEVDIQSYQSQPAKVPVEGRPRPSFPDFLIYHTIASGKRPLLVEVKHTKHLNDPNKSDDIKVKIAAFERYANEHGWDFRLVTDIDIRGPRLENYRFLYRYTERPALLDTYFEPILTVLESTGAHSVATILEHLAVDRLEQTRILPSIWHMLRSRILITDLDRPLTNSSIMEVGNV